jgi:hypothetical protein
LTPPAPAKTSPLRTSETGNTAVSGNRPTSRSIDGSSAHADGEIAMTIAVARKTSVSATLKNCARSSV